MQIAWLEVSTQLHLDRIQETVKVNYVQYGKSTKSKKGKKSTQSDASGGSEMPHFAIKITAKDNV